MTAPKSTIISVLLLALTFTLTNCGGGGSVTTVQAAAPKPSLPTQPNSVTCGPTSDGDACSFFTNIVDANGNALGYCQGETHYFPITKTYSFSLEVGINTLISDPNLSGCNVPLPDRFTLLNMRGDNSLIPFTPNQTTIVDWIYAMDAGHKASLYNGTLTAMNQQPVAVALQGDAGQNLLFATPHAADSILVWFNLDLPGSAPATIKVAGSGDTL